MRKVLALTTILFTLGIVNSVFANETETELKCLKVFEFAEDGSTLMEKAGESYDNLASSISIKGDFVENGKDEDYIKFNINNEKAELYFNIDKNFSTSKLGGWEINPDEMPVVDILCSKDKDENGFSYDYGVLDIFNGEYQKQTLIYETKEVQIYTGCYYDIVVNYYLRKKVGENKIGFITMPKYEKKQVMEEYKLYIANESLKKEYLDRLERKPKMNLGNKIKVDGKNYNEEKSLDSKDVHFGWDIGQFFVNGYTDKREEDGTYVFLKNVGDKISLWFELKQDIMCLNNNQDLWISIAESSDVEFEENIMGMGTLLIKAIDFEKNKQPNVVYNNFLYANTLTGANTEVNLFEEGDYEIALDYEIVNKGTFLEDKSNYKVPFKFRIRNGNCMIFPFDEVTGDELQDGAITKNGFHLDFARSRYLEINVERKEVIQRENSYKLDTRFSRPAKDGDKYIDEGIYIFKVKNKYTGEQITKTIYVGEHEIYKTLSRLGYSVEEINQKLNDGYIIENGKFVKHTEEE